MRTIIVRLDDKAFNKVKRIKEETGLSWDSFLIALMETWEHHGRKE